MFDTHCHLNFKAFKRNVNDVVVRAEEEGVEFIVVPGTDVKTSKKGVEIVQNLDGVYAAVGIHPHHVMKYLTRHAELDSASSMSFPRKRESRKLWIPDQVGDDVYEIEKLLSHPKVVAVGEVGLDNHTYENTVYQDYQIDSRFLELQKELFKNQIDLAVKYKKSLILHNREAKKDFLQILREKWAKHLEYRTVFHCCEPDEELLNFAKENHIFIGVDGDVTYSKEKQRFIKNVPLEMLVIETDSPFLLPEPLRTEKKYPNKPENIVIIAEKVASILNLSTVKIGQKTTENAKELFGLE